METPGNLGKRYSVPSYLRGVEEGVGDPDCGAVPGASILGTAALRTATTTIGATTATTTMVFVWCAVPGDLFTVRVGKWEFVESTPKSSAYSCDGGNSIQK